MENNQLKLQLHNLCLASVNSRFQAIQKLIMEIQESLTSETKSSAGDKHETGRAMLQLEREKAGAQLAEIQKQQDMLAKVDVLKTTQTICLGSVVETSQANYFIAVSAGEFTIDNQSYYAISPITPIGKLLLGKTVNETINFNEKTFRILNII
ncbi:3-oxoacyl-ACP synthase [Bizionia argentinensis JUB59]|uniref:3-oxoacyl-ACP synthase n=1 Tax=Bizionia argentinensis JUB59 TaxID=1046627 RepID=G2EEJ2_9FLAO|nr:3-oxoacyl-ACP synthase [Bizionia argentinensis]EGV43189.2 3-oxoacyl-ACP synthase [Bizionia argentinensis JUB59]